MTGRLTMICSGATDATRRAAFALDEELEPRALAKAQAFGRQLRRADRTLTGPAHRARQTAEALGLQPVEHSGLADQNMGNWAGKTLAEVSQEYPEGIAAWLSDPDAAPHGGESLAGVARRIGSFMQGLLAAKGHTIAVTHPAIIRAAVLCVLDAPPASFWRIDIEPLSLTEFRSDGRRWALRSSGVVLAERSSA